MGVGRLFEVLHLDLPVLRLAQIAERDGRDGEGRGDQGDPDEAVRLAAARRTVHVSIGVGVFGRLAVAQAAHRRIGSHLGRSRNAGFVVGPAGGLRLSVGRRGRTGKSGCAGCGLRTAGFLTQYLNVYKVKEGYFGYRPIFDSAQILITITSYGNDTLTPQKYNVYEIKSNKYLTEKPVAAGKTERDTVFYLNFDPVKEGVIGADDEPVFTFTFPDGETTGPATTAVTMNTTPATQNFIDRLMLQKGSGTAYEDDYSIYSTDSLKQWVEEFKGLYLSLIHI